MKCSTCQHHYSQASTCPCLADDRAQVGNAFDILRAIVEYRAACDAVQPAWLHMIRDTPADTHERLIARDGYTAAMCRVRNARTRLIELALDGRSEVPT